MALVSSHSSPQEEGYELSTAGYYKHPPAPYPYAESSYYGRSSFENNAYRKASEPQSPVSRGAFEPTENGSGCPPTKALAKGPEGVGGPATNPPPPILLNGVAYKNEIYIYCQCYTVTGVGGFNPDTADIISSISNRLGTPVCPTLGPDHSG